MDPIVLKRQICLKCNRIFVQFLIPSAVNWLSYMHITGLPGLAQVGFWQGLYKGSSLAGSTHGEVYV